MAVMVLPGRIATWTWRIGVKTRMVMARSLSRAEGSDFSKVTRVAKVFTLGLVQARCCLEKVSRLRGV